MNKMKKIVAGLLAAALTIGSLAGCSPKVSDEEYPNVVVATYGSQEIKLGEVNFYLRNAQYMYEVIYGAYYGEDMWEMVGTGTKTMEDSVKEAVVNQVYQIYVLNDKAAELNITLSEDDLAKVEEAVENFLDNTADTIQDELKLDREALDGIYTRNALANRAWEYAVKDTNLEVTDEEAAQRKVTMITLVDSSEDYDSEEMKDKILAALKDGETMEDIAKENDLTATPYTLGEGDYEDSIGPTAMDLKEGEYEALYLENYAAWYVMYCDSEFDEEATEEEKEAIVIERQAAEFEEVYAEWKAEAEAFEVDEDALDLMSLETPMYETTEAETKIEGTTEAETTEEETSEEASK